MRYFLLVFGIVIVLGMAVAGKRGSLSRRPPIEVFPDMDRQLKLRPMQPDGFFANGISSQPHIAGTIPRGEPIQTAAGPVFPYEDSPVNTGRIPGTTNFVPVNPLVVDAALMKRGRERFTIYCSPCHGQLADGNGVTRKYGMAAVANLHDKRIVEMPDGEIFNTITHGKNLMQPYGPQVDVRDRWAIIAYVRALQLSQLGTIDDVPEAERASLKK
ncbi:MAG TPA: cytochrome c [Verrucomicrobiae bacterium]|jgi:mono/diheme cytochrome c family protein|nr:cytochrome c [Verrucomicrobiae bacterium]